ncbi:hypothetical protein [uncultured Desulfovibrio sp.]|uniref:VgrG-related protein n=1 Tax=uncultured Desulfovibrio sp. TaxID=167968 RepID=UPI002604D5D4|nr:hypothetical protein [uncultured Desulfovibrio sp.]
MAGVYGNMMAIPNRGRGGALPSYQGGNQPYTPGANVSARTSDAGGSIAAAAAEASANALGNLAGAADRAVQTGVRAYEDYSKTRATQLLVEYQTRVNDAMYGDGGILTRKGDAAFDADKELARRSQEIREEVLGDYKGSLAGNFFDVRIREFDAGNMLKAQKYKGDQYDAWSFREDSAAADMFAKRAAQNYANHEEFIKDVAQAEWHIKSALKRKGYGPEAMAKGIAEARSAVLGMSIQQAIANGDMAGAERLLHKAGDGGRVGDGVARYESGREGVAAIGYDKNGGTSYGKYQLSSKQGSLGEFLSMLEGKGGEHAEIARRLRAAGPADTGGKDGAFPEQWKKEASANPALLEEAQREYIEKTHYQPVLDALPESLAARVAGSAALQEMVWSTAVQHGAGGAGKLLRRAWREGMNDEDFVRAVYAARGTQFGSSTPDVRASVQARFKREEADILSAYKSNSTPGASPSLFGLSPADRMKFQGWIEAGRKQQNDKAVVETVNSLLFKTKGLPSALRESTIMESLNGVDDLDQREKMLRLAKEELSFEAERVKAADGAAVYQLVTEGRKAGESPMQFQRRVNSSQASEEAKKKAVELFNGKLEENELNMRAMNELREVIDAHERGGKPMTQDEVFAFAYDRRLTTSQTKDALKYLENGGNLGELKQSDVNNAWQALQAEKGGKAEKKNVPIWLYGAVRQMLPPGKDVNSAELRKLTARAIMEGTVEGRVWGRNSRKYGQALVEGTVDTFEPKEN